MSGFRTEDLLENQGFYLQVAKGGPGSGPHAGERRTATNMAGQLASAARMASDKAQTNSPGRQAMASSHRDAAIGHRYVGHQLRLAGKPSPAAAHDEAAAAHDVAQNLWSNPFASRSTLESASKLAADRSYAAYSATADADADLA
jgi:hypothetical protein